LGERGGPYMVLVEKREEKRPLGNLGIVGMIILKLILKKSGPWIGLIWL
jgi:hypothetical protein